MADTAEETQELPKVRRCGTEKVHLRLLLEVPEYAERRAAIENHAWRMARLAGMAERTGCTRIPVVVHVVHRTDAENISQEQIDSQMTVLNADFRRRNADIGSVPPAFQSFTADSRIEFALATTDPSGNPTDGVTRTNTSVNGFTDDDAVKSAATGGADAWPADRYLNVWVCRLGGGLLGYAQFPGGPAATDGVVITHTGFGTTGTAAAPFDGGRTLVHEIGHWLNLRHIWGDDENACSGDDFVADTPNQAGSNTGTPTFPNVSCGNGPNGDMFMNYMDYVDDAAMMMFTTGQVDRMQAALDGPRSSIGTSIPCDRGKLKFTDEPVTLKIRDDNPPTSLKNLEDPVGTVKFADDPIVTLRLRDEIVGTAKFADEPQGTFKGFEDVKMPGLDKGFADQIDPGEQVVNPAAGGGRTPFVLATPHHSRAWQQSFPGAAQAQAAAYEQQLAQYEQAFQEYARAEAAGELGEAERTALQNMYAEYTRLAQEYQQLMGGGA